MPDLSSQSETIDLKGTCTSVAADGTAAWTFSVEAVAVETTVDSGGKLKFESKKDKECVKGLVRYAAIKGVTFTATVGADGAIKSISIESWPTTCDIKIDKSTTVKNSAANQFHDPTSAREWLELIFNTGPGKGKEWKRTLYFGNQEEVDMKSDGAETVSGDKCARIKLDTADQPKDAANSRDEVTPLRAAEEFWRTDSPIGQRRIAPGSGRVDDDVGLPPPEAPSSKIRSP